ncbi:MAG: UvrD-helicase domain-containing protein, partial [Bilophila sp.]
RLHADAERLVTGLFDCAAHCLQRYAAYKETRGLADFVDLEHRFQLMLDKPGVLERLAPRCKVLLVDEFQDTNPMQLNIFQRLLELAQHTVWVGDPKQAIYGFRGADASLMDAVVAHFEQEGAQVKELPTCRRTLQPLVDFTNAYFSEAFGKPLAVKAHRTQTGAMPPLHWWKVLKNTKGRHAKERTAGAVACGIQELLSSGAQIFQKNGHGEQVRPLRPDDVAVLCRGNKDCLDIAKAL